MMRQRTQLFRKSGGRGRGGVGGGVVIDSGGLVLGGFVDGRGGPDADIAVCGLSVKSQTFGLVNTKKVPRPPVANRSPSGETWQE